MSNNGYFFENFAYVLVNQIFPDNETVTTAQPCPRCIAGEPVSILTFLL